MDESLVTPLLVTHYSPKAEYGDLAPPSTGLIDTTITSLYNSIQQTEFLTPPVLVYNHPHDPPEGSVEYLENLSIYCDSNDIQFRPTVNHGLRTAILTGLYQIDNPYVFFIEHDWEFIDNIDMEGILTSLNEYRDINYIRFNSTKNESPGPGWDKVVKRSSCYSIPLCKVSSFCNHPHIARISSYLQWIENSNPGLRHLARGIRRDWAPYGPLFIYRLIKYILYNHKSQLAGWDDVENVIQTKYKMSIDENGFENAHKRFGTYLYGDIGDGPYIRHLGKR